MLYVMERAQLWHSSCIVAIYWPLYQITLARGSMVLKFYQTVSAIVKKEEKKGLKFKITKRKSLNVFFNVNKL